MTKPNHDVRKSDPHNPSLLERFLPRDRPAARRFSIFLQFFGLKFSYENEMVARNDHDRS